MRKQASSQAKAALASAGRANAELSQIAQDLADLSLTGGAGVTSENFSATAGQTVFTLTNTGGVVFAVEVERIGMVPTADFTLNTAKNEATLVTGADAGDNVVVYYSVAVAGSGGSTDAADIDIADAGSYYTGNDVEAALQEVGALLDGLDAALGALL